jgi:pyruvate dehydrogenase E2 component (dihydrolipoamide acetyltransferase)
MRSEFRLPALGADMEHGILVEWHVKPGDSVKRGDVVAAVETDKGVIDLECFETGEVVELKAAPGTDLPVGAVLAILEVEARTAATASAPMPSSEGPTASAGPAPPSLAGPAPAPVAVPSAPAPARLRASPAARARARELGVALDTLRGSGPGGAIELTDVERAAAAAAPRDAAAAMRAAIAAAMTRSKREIPHYYLSLTLDFGPATAWLERHNAAVEPAQRLLYPALLLQAVACAAREVAGFNGFYRDDRFEASAAIHLGVAIALRGGGLVAPAILDAADKPLDVLMRDFRDLVSRARAGRLRGSELASPTITVTSLGDVGVETVLPVIHPPQVAMVGVGSVQTRPWVVDGVVQPRPLLTLSLAADHRASDGRRGADFLARIRQRLENPEDP